MFRGGAWKILLKALLLGSFFLIFTYITFLRQHASNNSSSVGLLSFMIQDFPTYKSAGNESESKNGMIEVNSQCTIDSIANVLPYKAHLVNVHKFLSTELGEKWSEGSKFPCRQATIASMSFPICLYNSNEDIHVSRTFHSNGYWEQEPVRRLLNFLEKNSPKYNSSIGFVDIGANIGTYALPVAHLGYPVLAIEPNKASLTRLAASIAKGKINEKVMLYRMGVSNKRELIHLGEDPTNRGDTTLTNCQINMSNTGGKRCIHDPVCTVLLNDLRELVPYGRAVLKIDIQCAELMALNPTTASRFFHYNDIPIILMEWECFSPKFRILLSPSHKILLQEMFTYLTSINYTAFNPLIGTKIQDWWNYGGPDVVLVKNYGQDRFRTW